MTSFMNAAMLGWVTVIPGPGLVWTNSTHYILGWKSISLIVIGALALIGSIFGPIIHYNKYQITPYYGVHLK